MATLQLSGTRLDGVGRRGSAVRDGGAKACRHGGRHAHGTRSRYVLDRCCCAPCTRANGEYQTERNRLIAAGQWAPLVDAGAVVAHVQGLIDAGMRRRQIAAAAGVSFSVVSRVLACGVSSGVVGRVRAGTAQRLLTVPRPEVDGTGTRRRLQALVAIGWTPALLDVELGQKSGCAEGLLQADLVSDTTAGQVAWLFERLWDCPPPQHSDEDKQAAEQARARASQNGWGPPMAWDEELNPIDDPDAEADLGERVRTYKVPPGEELLFLSEAGDTNEALAHRFGVRVATIRDALRKARAAQEPAGTEASAEAPDALDGAAARTPDRDAQEAAA